MNEAKTTLSIIDGIYDITPPEEPILTLIGIPIINIAVICIVAVAILLLFKYFHSKKSLKIRALKLLLKNYSQNGICERITTYQMCMHLRDGLNLNHLSKQIILPPKISAKEKEWQDFLNTIYKLRYSRNLSSSPNELINALTDSISWMKIWP